MGSTRTVLIIAGVSALFCIAWQLDSMYTPPSSTPEHVSKLDKKLLEGSKHVAPLAYKAWVQEQMRLAEEQAINNTANGGASHAADCQQETAAPAGSSSETSSEFGNNTVSASWGHPDYAYSQHQAPHLGRIRVMAPR